LDPVSTSGDVALFWVTPVTSGPMTELMIREPAESPMWVIVPALLRPPVEKTRLSSAFKPLA
jgi:hypothetical protein